MSLYSYRLGYRDLIADKILRSRLSKESINMVYDQKKKTKNFKETLYNFFKYNQHSF